MIYLVLNYFKENNILPILHKLQAYEELCFRLCLDCLDWLLELTLTDNILLVPNMLQMKEGIPPNMHTYI